MKPDSVQAIIFFLSHWRTHLPSIQLPVGSFEKPNDFHQLKGTKPLQFLRDFNHRIQRGGILQNTVQYSQLQRIKASTSCGMYVVIYETNKSRKTMQQKIKTNIYSRYKCAYNTWDWPHNPKLEKLKNVPATQRLHNDSRAKQNKLEILIKSTTT